MTGLEIPLIMGVGTLLSAGGKIAAGVGQAQATQEEANLKDQQADETLKRAAINTQLVQEQAVTSRAGYETGVAAQGSGMAGIGGELQIQRYANEKEANINEEAQFEAQMLRAGASMESNLAGEQAVSGVIGGAGSFLSGGAGIYNAINKPSGVAQPLFGGL